MQNLYEVKACLGGRDGVGPARQKTWFVGRIWAGLKMGLGLPALRIGAITMPTLGLVVGLLGSRMNPS